MRSKPTARNPKPVVLVSVRITCLRGSSMSSHGLPAAASWNGMDQRAETVMRRGARFNRIVDLHCVDGRLRLRSGAPDRLEDLLRQDRERRALELAVVHVAGDSTNRGATPSIWSSSHVSIIAFRKRH